MFSEELVSKHADCVEMQQKLMKLEQRVDSLQLQARIVEKERDRLRKEIGWWQKCGEMETNRLYKDNKQLRQQLKASMKLEMEAYSVNMLTRGATSSMKFSDLTDMLKLIAEEIDSRAFVECACYKSIDDSENFVCEANYA